MGLDVGSENYQLTLYQWEHIGRETAKATRTIPAEFVGILPDIAQDRNLYKAEAYAFWIQYIAPALLEGRLPVKHLLLLRKIIFYCLEFTITASEVDDLEDMIRQWVGEYEEYYYQFRANRLPACPLTIHALLHIPYYIRHTGPLWTSWAFVMERFCGHLLPAVKNRVQPYENLDYYIQRRAQIQVVSNIHNLSLMKRPRPLRRVTAGGVEISSRETVYPECPSVRKISMDTQLLNQITKFLGPMFPGRSAAQLKSMVRRDSLVRYGSVRIAGSGDKMRTFNPKYDNPVARDNTYVRYTLFPYANAAFRHRPDVPQREIQYGQLTDIFKVNISDPDGSSSDSDDTMSDDSNTTTHSDKFLLLARLLPCDTQGRDATHHDEIVRYDNTLTPIMVDLRTIEAVIGRIERANGWVIVDRSGSAARTTFTDDAEDDE
ncbi:hypothetical protein BDV93DRAFT_560783 [Ceratobasidium sp. AG-I]|nr:hypothetical protein BDV93DRAFT_560783 [Ceratobasidium sp. AG-I]